MTELCEHPLRSISFDYNILKDKTPVVRAHCACGHYGMWIDYPKNARFSARLKAVENIRLAGQERLDALPSLNPPPGEKVK